PAFDHELGLDAEKSRAPKHHVGDLAGLERPDVGVDAKRAGGVDGVFGDEALDAFVVATFAFFPRQPAALILHLRGKLPCPADDLADAAHALAVGAEHGDGADIVEDVLGRDGLRPDAALGKPHIL